MISSIHNCTDNFQMYNSNTEHFFPQIQFCVFNLLLIIACNWTYYSHSKAPCLHILKTINVFAYIVQNRFGDRSQNIALPVRTGIDLNFLDIYYWLEKLQIFTRCFISGQCRPTHTKLYKWEKDHRTHILGPVKYKIRHSHIISACSQFPQNCCTTTNVHITCCIIRILSYYKSIAAGFL